MTKVFNISISNESGYVKYNEEESQITIEFIKVSQKRKGVGTKLIDGLVQKIGHQSIDWGICLKEGEAFRNKLYETGVLKIQDLHKRQETAW